MTFQPIEDELKAIDAQIAMLNAPGYIEGKRKALAEKKAQPEKRASMLAAIDAEERALPDVIKHLNAQYHQLASSLFLPP